MKNYYNEAVERCVHSIRNIYVNRKSGSGPLTEILGKNWWLDITKRAARNVMFKKTYSFTNKKPIWILNSFAANERVEVIAEAVIEERKILTSIIYYKNGWRVPSALKPGGEKVEFESSRTYRFSDKPYAHVYSPENTSVSNDTIKFDLVNYDFTYNVDWLYFSTKYNENLKTFVGDYNKRKELMLKIFEFAKESYRKGYETCIKDKVKQPDDNKLIDVANTIELALNELRKKIDKNNS